MSVRGWSISLCCIVGLSACATNPVQRIENGALTDTTGASFTMTPASEEEALVWPLVDAGLRAKGMTHVAQDPRYLVNVGYTDRPGRVGAYVETRVTDDGEAPTWLVAPERRRTWRSSRRRVCTVSIFFNDARSGREIYRVRAAERSSAPTCHDSAARLVQAALADAP